MGNERRSVLVVDDDDQVRELLVIMLERQGYAVTAVRNGLEAVDELRRQRFDVIVADYLMPHLDGMRLVLLVRIMWPQIPVILLSDEPELSQGLATELGAFAWLSKPFASDEFLSCVDRAATVQYIS